MTPDRIGRWAIEGEIARGGMGVVFRARDPASGEPVAIKLLLQGPGASRTQQKRFQREIELMRRLRHPYLVAIQEAGEHAGCPYLVMELVAGESLQVRLQRGELLSSPDALALTRKLAQALAHAHERGVLHRDVKPANVLLDARGEPRLTDFGLGKALDPSLSGSVVTLQGNYLGTPGFWPPEQARGTLDRVGPASDVYALGATLYAALTGGPPYEAGTLPELFDAMERPLRPPSASVADVDPALEAVCLRCLRHEPEDRYASMPDLIEALDQVRYGAGAGRRKVAPGVLAAAIVLGGAGLAGWVLSRRSSPTPVGVAPSQRPTATASPTPSLPPLPSPSASPVALRERPTLANGFEAWQARMRVEQPELAALYDAATALALKSEFAQAEQRLTEAIAIDPDQAFVWMDRGTSRTFLERYEEALADYDRAVALGPDVGEAYYLRANAAQLLGRFEAATADLLRALELLPLGHPYVEVIVMLLRKTDAASGYALSIEGLLGRQQRAEARGDAELAFALVNHALGLDPSHVTSLRRRGEAFTAAARFPEAAQDFRRALESAPDDWDLHRSLANALVFSGDNAGGEAALSRSLALNPDQPRALRNRALVRFELGHAADAVADFTRLMDQQGEEYGLLAQRGRAYALGGDLDAARADFRRAAALSGMIQQALWLAALGGETAPLAALADRPEWQASIARHVLGRLSAAELLAEAESGGDERVGRLCEAHCYLGLLAERGGDYAVARAHYQQVIEHAVAGYVEVSWARLRLAQLDDD